jgi:pyruvate/2-oxoglutarate dehydrogenase complex dihydrolipoamide acyltransferase (E2) component
MKTRLFVLSLGLALAACASGPKSRPAPAGNAAADAASVDRVVTLLDTGQESAARKELKAVLKRAPNDPAALVLRDSLDKDPVELLGPRSFSYTVKPGETMLVLADRFLGNRLKSYQLARYNGIAVPASLTAGTVLKIPGEAPRPTPAPAPTRPEPAKPGKTKPKPAAPKPSMPAPARPAANPVAAAQARAAGLAALNGGRVAQAVNLLRRARALDPGNPLIQRDLARAERIAQAVRTKR